MRLLSLLLTLVIVAWLICVQLGKDAAPAAVVPYQRAEAKAEAVDAQVQDQFARQAEALSRMENGAAAEAANPAP